MARAGVLLAAVLAGATTAQAQRMLALGAALTTTREAARVYVQSLDFGPCGLLPGDYPLAGQAPLGKAFPVGEGRQMLVATQGRWPKSIVQDLPFQTWWQVLHTAPFDARPATLRPGSPGWREWPAAQTAQDDGGDVLLILGEDLPAQPAARGRIAFWTMAPKAMDWTVQREIAIDAVPVAAAFLPGTARDAVVVAHRGKDRPPLLLRVNGQGGVLQEADLAPPAMTTDTQWMPAALAAADDRLLLLTSGYALGATGGALVSWLYVLDPATLAPTAAPLRLPGRAAGAALYPVGDQSCWVATETPGEGFAQLCLVQWDAAAGLTKLREIPQGGVLDQVLVAPDPTAPKSRVAMAFDQRVLLWSEAGGISGQRVFDNAVGVLHWSAAGLVAAEGPFVHRLDAVTLADLAMVSTPGVWTTQLLPLDAALLEDPDVDCDGLRDDVEVARGANPRNPDSDGDGLPDGVDPVPQRATPQIMVPESLVLRGEAAGRALRALPVQLPYGSTAAWEVRVLDPVPPWLVLYPKSGRGPGVIYLGVDPASFRPGDPVRRAAIQVGTTRATALEPVVGSPAITRVDVTPVSNAGQRILWVWGARNDGADAQSFRDPLDPHGLAGLGDTLAGMPYLFSHIEAHGPYSGALTDYNIVVLTAAAAAQGALTRQTVLDFVAGGGAMLFLGKYLGETVPPGLESWLAPLDIQINANVRVDGRYAGAGNDYLLRHWKDFVIRDGCAIRAAPGHTLMPGGKQGGGAVFVAREYGYGRIALLASATPLSSEAVRRPEERRFALDLFRWLGRAGLEVDDTDGDGLPDRLEDRNNNGAVDPGETDYLSPDSDRDGIPDGMEDANRNGETDEGETDPRSADTDGDGLLDGGDPQPYAAFGAPLVISAAAPDGAAAEGPAEGDTLLYLTGRNFAADSIFWFGDRRAPWQTILDSTQALVRTPDYPDPAGGDVALRVVSAGSGLERTLPQGFRYTTRSTVTLRLTPDTTQLEADGRRTGTMSLQIAEAGTTALHQVAVLLRVQPAEGFTWEVATPGGAALQTSEGWLARPVEAGGLLLATPVDTQRAAGETTLARCAWSMALADADGEIPVVTAEIATATTEFGGALHVVLAPVPLYSAATP